MWKYIPTDEMFVKKQNNILYHSDTYLGKDFSDGIKHWKYIKREKKNGRWVYYYDESDLINAKKQYDDSIKKAFNSTAAKRMSKYDLEDAKKNVRDNNQYYDMRARMAREKNHEAFSKWLSTSDSIFKRREKNKYAKEVNNASAEADKYENKIKENNNAVTKAQKEYNKAKKNEDTAWKKFDKADKKYDKERISSQTVGKGAKVVVKGLNAVSKAKQTTMKAATKAKEKGKKIFKKIFGK